jgi:hypothetical protein
MRHSDVLILDAGGIPHHWMDWEDAITLKAKGGIAWEYGQEDSEQYHGGTSRITGERSIIEVAPIIAVKGKFKYDRRTPPLTNANLFRRDLNICAYCGRWYQDSKLSRDHIIPQSRKGGVDTWMNTVTACKPCNWEKDDSTPEEAKMPLLYVPYVPSHEEKLILQNRKILACQHDFLAALLPEHSRVHQLAKLS